MIESLSNQNTPRVMVSDLDAILSEPVFFKIHGKQHEIKPVSTLAFLKFTNALNTIQSVQSNKESSESEVIDATTAIIQSIAPSIQRKDIEDSTGAQIYALYQLILDSIAGRLQGETKKKTELRLLGVQKT